MPKVVKPLTATQIKALCTEKPQQDFTVGGVPGLILRVSKTGRKTWMLQYRHQGHACATLAAVSACTHDEELPTRPTASPASALIQDGRIEREAVQALFPGESHFVDLAEANPAFAGYFLEGRKLVVGVSEPTSRDDVKDLVVARITKYRRSGAPSDVEARTVAFSFLQLANWRNRALSLIGSAPGVVSLDLDERQNQLTIGVEVGTREAALRDVLTEAGVPSAAIGFEEDRPAMPTVGRTLEALSNTVRPLAGGFQIRTKTDTDTMPPCTAGVMARRYPSGTGVMITVSHCTEDVFDLDSNNTEFGNNGVAAILGSEVDDPEGDSCSGTPCRASDAALFTIPHDSAAFGEIARTEYATSGTSTSGSQVVDSLNPRFSIVQNSWWPTSGDSLDKVGIATGWTKGEVDDTCETQSVGSYKVTCSYSTDILVDGGDSGSPVFEVVGAGEVDFVGIIFGSDQSYGGERGLGYFSSVGALYEDFGQMMYFPEDLDVSIPGPWEVPSGETCTYFASAWGGKPPYSYQWSGVFSGSGVSIDKTLSSSGYLTVTVTDADSNQTHDTVWIDVDAEYECEY